MKKLITLILFLSISGLSHLHAQCSFTHTQSGNAVTLNYSNALSPFFTIDSVEFTFGDGNTSLQINTPPSSVFSFSLPHTYATSGSYMVCMQQYTSWGGAPQTPCSHCETIVVGTTSTCFATANYNSTMIGLTTNFTNTSNCPSCISSGYEWDFGDGTAISTATSPNHTYAAAGTYNVCLVMTAVDASQITCVDTFCYAITVQEIPVLCTITADYSYILNAHLASFTNTSACSTCNTTTYFWTFGDATTSLLENPLHQYTYNGNYNVCLYTSGTTSTAHTCLDTVCKSITITNVGICDINPQNLHFYPNPATGIVYVSVPEGTDANQISIIDMAGRTISTIEISTNQKTPIQIDLNTQARGTYLLQLYTREGIFQSQLIKE